MPTAIKKGARKARNVYVRDRPGARKEAVAGSGLRGARKTIRTSAGSRRFFQALFSSFPGSLGKTAATRGLRTALVSFILGCALIIVLGSVGFISMWLYEKAVTSDFFATSHIDVTGNVRMSRETVLDYAGIREGDNSLALSIGKIEKNLRNTPWVEEVSVKRLLPNRFVIRLKERMPSFWVQVDRELYYANDTGEPIAPVEGKNFLSLPTLRIEPGAEEDRLFLKRLLQDIRKGALPIEAGAISSVTGSMAQGVEIYLEDLELRLSLATDDWEGNLSRMALALGDLSRRDELKNVREVRAVDGNVWVRLNGSAGT